LAQGLTLEAIAKKHGIKRPALSMHQRKRRQEQTHDSPLQEGPMPEEEVEVLEGQMSLDADTATEDPVSTIVDILPVNGEISEPLSLNEVQTLEHYEQIIAQGIKTFVQVGHALLTIREHHLYRARYSTFEEYCRQRWDLSRPRAYQLMDAAQVIDTVSTIVDIAPANEAQARPLTSLPPAQQVEVWREVVETAPPSGITAKHVQETVKRVKTPSTGTKTQTVKPFDVHGITSKIKELYMDWLKHCETDDALETAQFFLNTLSDLAQGRAMLLHRQ
jgi:hypothetical protein